MEDVVHLGFHPLQGVVLSEEVNDPNLVLVALILRLVQTILLSEVVGSAIEDHVHLLIVVFRNSSQYLETCSDCMLFALNLEEGVFD
jgi:hypothetical protein